MHRIPAGGFSGIASEPGPSTGEAQPSHEIREGACNGHTPVGHQHAYEGQFLCATSDPETPEFESPVQVDVACLHRSSEASLATENLSKVTHGRRRGILGRERAINRGNLGGLRAVEGSDQDGPDGSKVQSERRSCGTARPEGFDGGVLVGVQFEATRRRAVA